MSSPGVLGNGFVVAVIVGRKHMQTVTNIYLLNLAVTDILSLAFSELL